MRVSVIVPLYDKAPWVNRCLESIAAQTLADFEAIVVDDGSTDGGGEIAARFPDRRFRLIRQANAGPGAARNRGAREARGELLAFLDADDAWLPPFLEHNVRILDRHAAAASASSGWIDYPGKVSCAARWSRRGISEGQHAATPATSAALFDAMATYMTPCTTVIRAAVFHRFGGFAEGGCRYAEDAALWVKVLFHSPVCFHLLPHVELHREAARLSGNYMQARPVEPFLADPETLLGSCPDPMRPLARRFLALRASKTACMLGYWGDWRRARDLRRRFVGLRDWRLPLFFPAVAAATPPGALAGSLLRKFRPPAARLEAPAAKGAAGGV